MLHQPAVLQTGSPADARDDSTPVILRSKATKNLEKESVKKTLFQNEILGKRFFANAQNDKKYKKEKILCYPFSYIILIEKKTKTVFTKFVKTVFKTRKSLPCLPAINLLRLLFQHK